MSDGSHEHATAIVLMAYGGPDCLDAVGPFMRDLTGRDPGPEMLARIQARYAAIGGKSPLPEIALGMAATLESLLAERGIVSPVIVGFCYTSPKIGDVLRGLYDAGIRDVVGVSLSPFESKSTGTAYEGAVEDALADLPDMRVTYTPALGGMPIFAALHAQGLQEAYEGLATPDSETLTVFTAHSLPVSDLEDPELYASGLRRVADEIAQGMGLDAGADFCASERLGEMASFGSPDSERPWLLAYQSKGQRPGEWLGPDIAHVMDAAARNGFRAIAVSPIGFATEHMETRYDLDVVEAKRAADLGLEFARGSAPNGELRLVDAIASAVIEIIGGGA